MKKWETPEVSNLSLDKTAVESDYVTVCNWNEAQTLGLGNEEYRDPNNKPANHKNWVWCAVHGQWHPKVHTGEETQIS